MFVRSAIRICSCQRKWMRSIFLAIHLLLVGASYAYAATELLAQQDLTTMSLEELATIQITSVSKKAQALTAAPASVFVITNRDIVRSGATSLPEVLRLAPNLDVAAISAQSYAISARGFNSSTANKLLVLIDGRTIYTPLYSGVFWDAQDFLLDDIERIEVISGPAGTLWGTNAVNGVINIITRSAEQTQGTLLSAGGGNEQTQAQFRYGAQWHNDATGQSESAPYYRFYAKYTDHTHTETANDRPINDGWNRSQAGFRIDWKTPNSQSLVQGDIYQANLAQSMGEGSASGMNILARNIHTLDGGGQLNLSAYYDRTERNFPLAYHQILDIFNLEFLHTLPKIGAHDFVWGSSYRYARDHEENSINLAFLPERLDQAWASLFAEDTLSLSENWKLSTGLRLEHNDYTGWEFLPNLRLAWQVTPQKLLWTSFARTVRAPSRIDRDVYAPARPPYLLVGNSDFGSEVAYVYELGYRAQVTDALLYSVTAFHSIYRHLRSIEQLPSGGFTLGNYMQARVTGVEAWMSYQATSNWRLSAGYHAINMKLRFASQSTDNANSGSAGIDPPFTWQLRSSWDIDTNHDFDIGIRHVASLPIYAVPAYTAIDLRLAKRVDKKTEVALIGRNLGDNKHAEFGTAPSRSEIGASIFLQLKWHH